MIEGRARLVPLLPSTILDSQHRRPAARDTGCMPEPAAPAVRFELFSSAFCGACHSTRAVLAQAAALVPGTVVEEHDVAFEPDYSEAHDIQLTPTVIVRASDGRAVFRAQGVPTLDQALAAAALALPA